MNIQSEWITVKQAMQLLQITSRTTLYKYAFKHNLKVAKPVGKVYFNRNDILAILTNSAITMGF